MPVYDISEKEQQCVKKKPQNPIDVVSGSQVMFLSAHQDLEKMSFLPDWREEADAYMCKNKLQFLEDTELQLCS